VERIRFEQPILEPKPQITKTKLPIEFVDKLAAELSEEYHNVDFVPWYCKLIYEFGEPQIREWQRRAKDGRSPGRLFTKMASEALRARKVRQRNQ
jgi:hypothetical protein